jgi:hypothetical protein
VGGQVGQAWQAWQAGEVGGKIEEGGLMRMDKLGESQAGRLGG